MLFVLAVCSTLFVCLSADKFPSLLTTNATLAVVIDREFMADDYDAIKEAIEVYMVYAKRELLKHGGVNVQYYSWANINVKRDITALISIASCEDTWRLFNAAEDENLLHMAISESDCPRLPQDQAVTVPMIEKGQEMPQIVLDLRIIAAYKWNSATVLFDYTLERDMVTRVVSGFTAESSDLKITGAAISLIALNTTARSPDTRKKLLDKLSKVNTELVGTNFLAVVGLDMVEPLMEAAKSLDLVNTKNQWLYVICDTNWKRKDISHVKQLLREGDNVAFIYNTTIDDVKCTGGLKCHAEEILEGFTKSLDGAILDENELASQVSDEEWEAIRPNKLERRNFLLHSVKNYLLQHGICDNCTTWRLQAGETWGKEYQNNATESVAELLEVGTWRPSDGPTLQDQLFPHVAHGFRKKTLPLISFHNPPWQILKLNDSGAVVEYGGLVFDVIKELSKNLNFTYTVQVTQDEFIDTITKENTTANLPKYNVLEITNLLTNIIPDKIINMVRNKTVAIGACGFTVTNEAKALVNFTMPISIQTYAFLAARPRELSRALLFMSPFTFTLAVKCASKMYIFLHFAVKVASSNVAKYSLRTTLTMETTFVIFANYLPQIKIKSWLCLAAAVVLMGPILYIIHRLSPVYEYKGIPQGRGLSSPQNCIWYMYGALLQQGGMHLPYADSARLIVGTWWLVVLVVATTYCGNLVAFLTFPKIDIPITTVDELLAHRETVTWTTVKGSYFEKILKESEEPKFRELYKGMMKDSIDQKRMISLIEQGRHVFFDWKTRLHYYMKKQYLITDRCDLALGTEDFANEQIAMIMAQDTPYLRLINDEIKRLHQVGLIEKWYKNYLPKKDRCFKVSRITEVTNHTVNMDDMQGSFFVLVIGFLLASIWLLGEKLVAYYLHNKKQQVRPYVS